MKPFIVVSDGMDKDVFSRLQSISDFDVFGERKISQDQLNELAPKVNGIVIRSATKITPEFLDKATNLKYVIRAGEGTDNIDKVECEKRGVKVSNTPGANNNSAAEHALALTLTAFRKISFAHNKMMNNGWDKSLYTGIELLNKKVGVVGFGRIGQLFAKRIQGFDPEILFFDPFCESSDIPNTKKAESLEEIFKTCDVISLHTPLLDSTRKMISKELIDMMPEHAVLVNASRGGIVDEDALLDALTNNRIRGAAFDVFENEPLAEDHPFRKLDNMVITPHLGASTEEAQINVGKMAVDQLQEFFLKDNLVNEVKA